VEPNERAKLVKIATFRNKFRKYLEMIPDH